jgi:hypothetical protein
MCKLGYNRPFLNEVGRDGATNGEGRGWGRGDVEACHVTVYIKDHVEDP